MGFKFALKVFNFSQLNKRKNVHKVSPAKTELMVIKTQKPQSELNQKYLLRNILPKLQLYKKSAVMMTQTSEICIKISDFMQ